MEGKQMTDNTKVIEACRAIRGIAETCGFKKSIDEHVSTILSATAALTAPAESVEVAIPDMTPNQVPDWVDWPKEDYASHRNRERDQAARIASEHFGGDWIKAAASYLHSIYLGAPVMGSHGHYCAVLSQALMQASPPSEAARIAELEAALEAAEKFHSACYSAWASGEPKDKVVKMLDAGDELTAVFAKLKGDA